MNLKGKIILILLLLTLFCFSGCAFVEIRSSSFEPIVFELPQHYFIPTISLYVLFLIIFGIWLFFDARKRGKSAFWVILIMVFMPLPWGIIGWLVFRPPIRDW